MSNGVRRSNRESSVQYTCQESDTIAPARQIVFREGGTAPDRRAAGVLLGHSGHDDDGDEAAANDEEKANVIKDWKDSVGEDDDGGGQPGDEYEGNVYVPWLDDEIRVEDGVHLDGDIGRDGDNGCEIEYPAEEVERAGKESYHPAVSGARRH